MFRISPSGRDSSSVHPQMFANAGSLIPLSEVRDQTHILMDTGQVLNLLGQAGARDPAQVWTETVLPSFREPSS